MENELILLSKIGLTEAESKVYLTLLQNGSLSGYEASKLAGVPRSKIYNLLELLKQKGFILYTEYENNNKYAAIPMSEVSERLKKETSDILTDLAERLSIYPQRTNMDNIWHIRNNENVFAKCKDIMKNTKEELLLQVWLEDIPFLINELKEMEKNNIRLGIVVFTNEQDLEIPLKKYCLHGMVEDKKKEMGGRWITLVSDMQQVVFGQILSDTISEVIWTYSRPMISLAAECVRHDMYFYKSAGKFKDAMQKEYGEDLKKIRDIF